jgi:spermidine synthase
MNLKRILSYFTPITILKKESKISKSFEVTWNDGKLVLDTENTNFSYGSLQKVLKKGLLEIGIEEIQNVKNILLLGVAGGSVIQTLVNDFNFKGKITGIEIEEEIIEIGNLYFDLDTFENLEIIISDAEVFVKNNADKYELIIIDIFQDNLMPDFLFEVSFINNLKKRLVDNGNILFNTIVYDRNDVERNKKYENLVTTKFKNYTKTPFVEGFNELFILKN